jgi:hypothetical protein
MSAAKQFSLEPSGPPAPCGFPRCILEAFHEGDHSLAPKPGVLLHFDQHCVVCGQPFTVYAPEGFPKREFNRTCGSQECLLHSALHDAEARPGDVPLPATALSSRALDSCAASTGGFQPEAALSVALVAHALESRRAEHRKENRMMQQVSRIATYYQRNGFRETLHRGLIAAHRWVFANQTVLFYWDLRTRKQDFPILPAGFRVEFKERRQDISSEDWERIVTAWKREIAEPRFLRRLENGAGLWLLRTDAGLAGYGWSTIGMTLEQYFFPLCRNDVYPFDFFVFPEFRGQGLLSCFLTHILEQMASLWSTRAYFEVLEWNQPSLIGTKKVGFERHQIGVARKVAMFGCTFVKWSPTERQMA